VESPDTPGPCGARSRVSPCGYSSPPLFPCLERPSRGVDFTRFQAWCGDSGRSARQLPKNRSLHHRFASRPGAYARAVDGDSRARGSVCSSGRGGRHACPGRGDDERGRATPGAQHRPELESDGSTRIEGVSPPALLEQLFTALPSVSRIDLRDEATDEATGGAVCRCKSIPSPGEARRAERARSAPRRPRRRVMGALSS
jgi:hypothetical protein